MIRKLAAEKLSNVCTPESIEAYLQAPEVPDHGIIGQERAQKALKLGLGMKAEGFNVFVSGIQGTGKLTAVKEFLETLASMEPTPPDWCYVNNFKNSYQPQKLSLPAGQAHSFKKEVKTVVQEALHSLIRAFESEAYAKKRQSITDKFEGQQNILISSLNEKAEKELLMIKQTPWEIYTVPLLDGKPMSEKQFDSLPVKEKEVIHQKQDLFADEIKLVLQQTRKIEKEASDELAKLEKEVAEFAIANLMKEMIEKYGQLPDVKDYLKSVEQDILENLGDFLQSYKAPGGPTPPKAEEFLKRYEVNVLVDNSTQKGAPIVIESNPTYNNLIGRVEKESIMGTLVTDFTMIRKGSLHSANGGYLIIRAEELFKNYFSWGALKRAIRNKEIMIEEATDQLGYLTTKTLKPDAIPLQVKVILIGDPYYYYLLYEYDSDFKTLFKVKSDFDTVMERSNQNISKYVQFARTLCTKENLTKPDSSALCKLIEYGSRLAQDQEKLSTRFEQIADVLREANHYAAQDKNVTLTGVHIIRSIEEKIYRSNLIQSKINEMIREKTIFIDITGSKTGQVNGLSVIDLGDIQFGKPNRITSTVNLGKSGVITIEREAELSGPLHTKGVMILTGYLAEKFFQDKPTSLSARLVFEQSYSEVEGDSASSTELYALLSNLADLPIKQGIAVTGSVNQKGEIQAIGGVNEKIEGYFEVCKSLGLNGDQGVIIPSSNEKHLALKQEVIDAVNRGQFHIWCVDSVEDGIEILTGCRAGNIAEEGTLFNRVNKMLIEYAERMKEFEGLDQPEEKLVRQKGWTTDIVLKK